ncbi:hypothetical protein A3C96_01805 [Candidatus Uhrbacteria bacterium RIFCSPHIGHO2_02_FULL_60_10]|uniref:Uncharacterized protein n=1 Tax=Candidatus Uhrbacteria bacterium RIFCSPHIGHO2_02_FULL_60_10 TaxID=1802392 RepID=A0A1F7U8J1_9BACT|nr:MAG: hypothetical protein A3C96_01805 [Candidatus Uhrbacteria bacterium RIFCSPHIGHO2_02_FULL_60_10]
MNLREICLSFIEKFSRRRALIAAGDGRQIMIRAVSDSSRVPETTLERYMIGSNPTLLVWYRRCRHRSAEPDVLPRSFRGVPVIYLCGTGYETDREAFRNLADEDLTEQPA